MRHRPAVAVLALASLVVSIPGAAARFKEGFPGRLPAKSSWLPKSEQLESPQETLPSIQRDRIALLCLWGERVKAVVIGDSHANSIITAVAAALPDLNDSVPEWSYNGAPNARNSRTPESSPDRRCSEFNNWVLEKLNDIPMTVPLIILS